MSRYDDIKRIKSLEGKRYIRNAIYPDIPVTENDIYIKTTGGDRYDTLALQFYNDSSLWWVIASANNSQRASLVVKPGVQLRIPGDIQDTLQLFDSVNENR
jgi:hypothetical protein|tara:strand:+ start:92 stop:394 length:303 start_codon:yes stop_codon:yes gene_type:complete